MLKILSERCGYLPAKKPDDYVIGTGKLHSVEDFMKLAFKQAKLEYRKYLIIDKKLIRKKTANQKKLIYLK